MKLTAFYAATVIALSSTSSAEEVKGLLRELKTEAGNEESNENKAFQSEVLITRAEKKAIENL